jgi:hypothetical protein
MIIKDKFNLLRNVDNTLSLSQSTLRKYTIENGPLKIFVVLELMRGRINHFTKDRVFKLISNIKEREIIKVVNFDKYLLPVTYNKPTRNIIINVKPFGVDDIMTTNPGPMNLYACIVYGIVFSEIASGRVKVVDKYSTVITNYLMSILLRAFGKEYGLLGSFSREIIKLKFLLNCYIMASFFGVKPPQLYKRAAVAAYFDYKTLSTDLPKFDFTDINDFIRSLDALGAMPNINRHTFTAKIIKRYTVAFLPAIEDLARYFAIMTASSVQGASTTVVPTYIYKYNERDFNNTIEFTKSIFKR